MPFTSSLLHSTAGDIWACVDKYRRLGIKYRTAQNSFIPHFATADNPSVHLVLVCPAQRVSAWPSSDLPIAPKIAGTNLILRRDILSYSGLLVTARTLPASLPPDIDNHIPPTSFSQHLFGSLSGSQISL
ncbi:uncharacterized protein N7469_006067 [Penicillium citrinum]|uniref:Uncharacterized protein n=2 Tax=Penicillium TaxID=5073 RepID=A0A9W9NXA8_PENCI|nr:uncharacterized protein N7469_006067 [Penicillium citrinum]KAJ5231479.1 hypothetical protein N7469_006067 [Penicillium citrinum]KAJ5579013.1 hypothetical protein N7450_007880 [Penicillium hetheringtonii]